MSHNYKAVTGGKLKLKGKNMQNARPRRRSLPPPSKTDPDADEHGGWWCIKDDVDFRGGIEIAIEAGDNSRAYLAALDNGTFTLGSNHFNEPQPYPEEILSLIKTPDDAKFSIKTGFGRYVGVDMNGQLIATAEAIGPRERFEAIFQDGKCAIQAVSSGLFLTWAPDEKGQVFVSSKKASEKEFINIRTSAVKHTTADWRPAEDLKESADCETSYNRMINYDVNDKSAVKKAQKEGTLHETLLNRRQKLKSDRYC
ncbi:FRG1-like family protein [Aphelenchoides fujianensis]|nr:FRG1-like family protein [Aphelenchoides fujianensis]